MNSMALFHSSNGNTHRGLDEMQRLRRPGHILPLGNCNGDPQLLKGLFC
jgi:hypothetical protein